MARLSRHSGLFGVSECLQKPPLHISTLPRQGMLIKALHPFGLDDRLIACFPAISSGDGASLRI